MTESLAFSLLIAAVAELIRFARPNADWRGALVRYFALVPIAGSIMRWIATVRPLLTRNWQILATTLVLLGGAAVYAVAISTVTVNLWRYADVLALFALMGAIVAVSGWRQDQRAYAGPDCAESLAPEQGRLERTMQSRTTGSSYVQPGRPSRQLSESTHERPEK